MAIQRSLRTPPDHIYTESEFLDLLEKARALGFSLDNGTILETLTVGELDVLVNQRQ